MRRLKTLGNVILGGAAMTLVMSVALAAERGGTGIMPLPPRPAADASAGQTSVKKRLQKPANTWRVRRNFQKPVVILNQPGPVLNQPGPVQRRLSGNASSVAPDGAPWPVIILAAAGDPVIGQGARKVEFDKDVFKPDPSYKDETYQRDAQVEIYGGKTAVDTQRPIIELGEPFYQVGPLGQGTNVLGRKNLVFGHLYAFGDWRTAVAYNDNGNGNEVGQIATRLNLDVDLGLTATERLHALFQPLQEDGQFTRCEFAGEASIEDCELEYDFEPQTAFFEGDLGAITAGLTGTYNDFDLPITGGLIPLIFQNGVWLEDAFIGGAAAIPSLNSKTLDISNMDITVFGGADKVTAPGVIDAAGLVADSNVNIYGIAAFIETMEGYIETGYAYIDAEDALEGQDYHSATAAFTKRYGGWLSNSMRVVASFGQDEFGVDGAGGDEQNGVMLLSENSFVTSKPYTLLPYANFFIGIERPVPAADDTGILKNTGINFESDALTGFPFLNDTGQNAYGGAIGLQYLFDLQQQLVFELALERDLADFDDSFDEIVGNQYAAGVRYQIPISNAWLIRSDAIYAIKEDEDDAAGARIELRWKF
ncbi:MAG: hypothetical protein OEU92_11995 [Alphaproteobacteria bacterium]|nr:hypothetical protein [Alphaproteobacteria bacterium]